MAPIPTQVTELGPDAALSASGPVAAHDLRWLTVLPITTLAIGLLLALLAPVTLERAGLPIAITGLLIGVPHGAVDHLVLTWADLTASRWASCALVSAYVSGAILAAAALLLAPTATVLIFLLVSALHFGTAETAFAHERRCRRTPPPWARPLPSAAHGGTVVGLLLLAHPQQVEPWLRRLAPGAAQMVSVLRTPGLVMIGLLVLAQVIAALARIQHPGRRAEVLGLAELALVVTTFAVAPPLVALGLYFGCWHAPRHTGRLLDLARQAGERNWWPATRRLAIASVLPTTVALTAMAVLVLARHRAPVVVEVAVLLSLTFPHSATVWFVDVRRRGRRLV